MKLTLFFLCIALFFTTIRLSSCFLNDSVYSKKNNQKTTQIRDGLYSEVFFIRSISNDSIERYSEYITDSVNFRKYVYTYNSCEWIYGEMNKNDILTIYKVTGSLLSDKIVFDTTKIADYDINELKRDGRFE